MADPSPAKGRQLKIGRYILGETLGVGTFGKVKTALHELTGHKVAVKILNRSKISSLDVADKITREIQILKLFRHPHIIKLYEVITTPKDIFMIMEFVPGGELFDYIGCSLKEHEETIPIHDINGCVIEAIYEMCLKHGKSSEDDARLFFQQIVSGVDYCHRHKVVHRDLKPENLLLDSYKQVKIADFGLSNLMKDGEFLRTSCGSPNYAAPEVVSGKLYAGPEVDVWSCGIILYALLCGTLPFEDASISMLFRKIKSGQFYLPPHLSKGASDLLSQMLQVNPVRRITIQQIREHTWFNTDLPQYLFPLPGRHDTHQIDSAVLAEVCQKLSVTSSEVIAAIRSGDRGHHLAVAYELVQDNRVLLSQTESLDKPSEDVYATSPPSSSFIMGETLTLSESKDINQPTSPGKNGSFPKQTSRSPVGESDIPIKLPRSYKRPKWHLGIRSQSHPQNIMQEIMKKLKMLDFEWKNVSPFFIRCRYKPPGGEVEVKLDLQLYQLDQRNFLLDFKAVDPLDDTSDEPTDSDTLQRHCTMEFFEACSRLISALAQ